MKREPAVHPIDVVIYGYFAVLTIVLLASWTRVERPWIYLALHLAMAGALAGASWFHARRPGRVTRFIHYWLPAAILMASFRELHFLVPQVHPWEDRRYDWALLWMDERLFGDVEGWCRRLAHPLAADALAFLYALFYPMPAVLLGLLYARGKFADLRAGASVIFFGWFLSYLGYVAVPAQGPHLVTDGPRAAELDGWFFSRPAHDLMRYLELEMPDAFPSGHTLVAILSAWMAWRYARRLFPAFLVAATGIIVATVYLRYHYVVDVVVGALLAPLSVWAGDAITRRIDPHAPDPAATRRWVLPRVDSVRAAE